MAGRASRVELPDLFVHRDYRVWLTEVVAARQRHRPTYALSSLARAARLPYGRLRGALQGRADLDAMDAARLSAHLRHGAEETQFLAFLVAFGQSANPEDRRRSLDGLVSILAVRAERAGQGAAFRARSRWEHHLVRSGLKWGALSPDPLSLAGALGISLATARQVLDDLADLGSDLELPDTLSVGPEADLPTLALADDLLLMGLRSLTRQPAAGRHALAHWALPLEVAAARRQDLDAVHVPVPVGAAGPLRPALLLTHVAPATLILEP